MTEAQGEAIRDLVAGEGASRTLETGLGVGLSALFICEGAVSSGDPEARHIAIDPLQKSHYDDVAVRVVRDAGLAPMFELRRAPSMLELPRLIDEALARPGVSLEYGVGSVDSLDAAFIDGDHRFEHAFLDIYYSFILVKPGGLLIVDDVWMPAVAQAVAYFEKNLGFERLPSPLDPPRRKLRLGRSADSFIHMAILRRPKTVPDRAWDHFERFA